MKNKEKIKGAALKAAQTLTVIVMLIVLLALSGCGADKKDGFVDEGGTWYYYQEDEPIKDTWLGPDDTGSGWWIFKDENAMENIKGWRYFDETGAMATGVKILGGYTYYFDEKGLRQTGDVQIGGITYKFDPTGELNHTGWFHGLKPVRYYEGNAFVTDAFRDIDGAKYYFVSDGDVAKGLKEIEGRKYFFDDTGAMVTGDVEVEGVMRRFREDGTMIEGFADGKYTVSEEDVNEFFSRSALVGNSTTLGLEYYLDDMPDGYMGNVNVVCRGSYSFYADEYCVEGYMLQYEGVEAQARYVLRDYGFKAIFINMGTNDLAWGPASDARDRYVNLLEGIREESPDMLIFVTSCTPKIATDYNPGLSNGKIDEFNELMRQYTEEQPRMHYIGFSDRLKDGNNDLIAEYCSDNYVHLNRTGCDIWLTALQETVRAMMEDGTITPEDYK